MGGIIIGYEIGKILNKETIFLRELMENLCHKRFLIKKSKSFNY